MMSSLGQRTIVFFCSLFWTSATTRQILNKHYWKRLGDYIPSEPTLPLKKRSAHSPAWLKTNSTISTELYRSSEILVLLLSFSILKWKIKYTLSVQNNGLEKRKKKMKRKKKNKSLIFQINEKQ